MSDIKHIRPARDAAPHLAQQSLLIQGLELNANIGVYDHEKTKSQPIRLWLKIDLSAPREAVDDAYEEVICYDTVVQSIRSVVASGHINLVETLAQKIAAQLFESAAIETLKIRIEKPDAFAEADGVGIECVFAKHPVSR